MIVWSALGLVIVSYIVIQILYRKYWEYNLEVQVFLPDENVHEGERASIREVIINDKFLLLPVLETRFTLEKGIVYVDLSNASVSDKLYRRDVFAVGMKRKISRTFEIDCVKRGYYTLDKLEIISMDLFMTQKFLGEISCFQEFYVYPKRVKSEKIQLLYQKIMGDLLVRKKLYEDPFSFGGIREYVNSDPMNRINWKATAKTQELAVNMYESSESQTVTIVLDTFGNQTTLEEALNEESIRIVAALSERFLKQGIEIMILANGCDKITKQPALDFTTKKLGITDIMQKLARLERGQEVGIRELIESESIQNFTIIVSQNIRFQKEIVTLLDDYVWVVPYRGGMPESNESRGRIIPWEIERYDEHA